MTCHEVSSEDLEISLNIEPLHLGDELVGRDRALANWHTLIQRRSFNSIIVKDDTAQGQQPVSFGASAFVTRQFADAELSSPRPGLASRFIRSLSSPAPAVLSDKDLAGASITKPIDVLMLCGSWRQDLRPDQLKQLEVLMPFNFVECHTGYPLHRIFNETVSLVQREFQFSSGVFLSVKEYPNTNRSLLMMNEASACSVSGSMAMKLFRYEPPLLGLRDTEKQLLTQALNGGDDEQIAARIHLAVVSVKKRWQSIFDRFEAALPKLFAEGDQKRETHHRGVQKRHHVLAYMREHPEEFRPYRLNSHQHRG